jgi:hypothetical protein
MADRISSDLWGDMDIDISGLGGDRGVGQNGGDMGGLIISPRGSVGDEAGGTSIRKFTCMCLFILEPLIPCHTAGPSFLATGTGPCAKRLEESVGEPGQDTGGETEKGGLLCTRGDAEEEGEDGTSALLSPSIVPPLL